jgi:RNA polymerase sigma factor (sigma-70 family)
MNERNGTSREVWLRQVVEQYECRLVRFVTRLLAGDVERARDVVQDAFLKLCREDTESVQDHVGPWLFTVCRNRALDIRKKESRMNPLSDVQAASRPSREPNQAETLETRESAGQALKLLASLPDKQQEVIRMKVEHGLSYREIGSVLGISVSNVGYLIHQGMKTLRHRYVLSEGSA